MMSSSHFQTTGQSTKSHPSSPAKTGRVYASVAEMKRKGKVRMTCHSVTSSHSPSRSRFSF